jgi:hypothetical protein
VEFVREYFYGCKGILKTTFVKDLLEDNENQNIRSYAKEKRYQKLPIETMPPLIVENGIVTDGNHRLRILRKKHIDEINIYDIVSY